MRLLFALAAFALAAACAPAAAPPPAEPTPVATPAALPDQPAAAPPADEASCKTAGGSWQPICRMQQPACVITHPDAGKACTSGDQCAGDCVSAGDAVAAGQAATGICSANSDPCGCRTRIEDGKSAGTICVD